MENINLAMVDKIHFKIQEKSTGNLNEFAKHIGLSRSMLAEYISYLRDKMFAPIFFNEHLKTYEYEYPVKFYLSDEIRTNLHNLSDTENSDCYKEVKELYDKYNNSDLFDHDMEPNEIEAIYGGAENSDRHKISADDNCSSIILDDDIDFKASWLDDYIPTSYG